MWPLMSYNCFEIVLLSVGHCARGLRWYASGVPLSIGVMMSKLTSVFFSFPRELMDRMELNSHLFLISALYGCLFWAYYDKSLWVKQASTCRLGACHADENCKYFFFLDSDNLQYYFREPMLKHLFFQLCKQWFRVRKHVFQLCKQWFTVGP